MGFFILPEINPGISQPAVCKIELHRRANVPFPLYVITFCPADEKGIFKIVQVRLDRVRVDGYIFYELKGVRKFLGVCQASYGGRQIVQ